MKTKLFLTLAASLLLTACESIPVSVDLSYCDKNGNCVKVGKASGAKGVTVTIEASGK